jgi:hypothetical protein
MSQPQQALTPQTIIADFNTQNWLITPAVHPTVQTSPEIPLNNGIWFKSPTWLVVLSGVAVANFTGVGGTEYTISISPDVTAPINGAVTIYGLPRPQGDILWLGVDQWAPYAAVGSTFDESHGTADAGFDVNTWRPTPFATLEDATTVADVDQVFQGIQVDMSVRESGPITYRLPYSITLLARIGSNFIP